MLFGMPTLVDLKSVEENARLCGELGLSFVELNMNLPYCQLQAIPAETLRRIAHCYGIFFTLHLDENLDPANFNPFIADAYVETAVQSVRLAKAVGIPLLNMHLNRGVYFTLPSERAYLYQRYPDHYYHSMERFYIACREAAGADGPLLLVENTGGFAPFQKEMLNGWLARPGTGLTLDIGHAHAAEYPDADFYRASAGRLRHFHLHDAAGRKNHLPLGEGEVEFASILSDGSDRTAVVEVKTAAALAESARWLRREGWME